MAESIRSQIASNVSRSWIMMAGFVSAVIALGYVFSLALDDGGAIMGYAFVASLIGAAASYFWGDQIVLTMSGARPADRKRDFDFFTVTENLSIAAGLPMPKLYVIEDTAMNAFATGRDPQHAVVCATTGLLSRLDRREIEGVVAHELSHIRNYDIRLMVVVAILAGTVAYAADFFMRSLWWGGGRRNRDDDRGGDLRGILLVVGIVLAILSPLMATIIRNAVSRKREYLADASGALLTRYPEGLARALEKLKGDREVLEAATNATAHLFIANPFKGKQFHAWFSELFDTHPPIDERIKRLRAM